MSSMVDELGEWLNAELTRRSWSMSELGRQAGYSSTQVSNVINGTAKPTADFTIRVANALNEDAVKLLRLADHLPAAPPVTDLGQAVCQTFRMLSVEQQRAVARIVFDMAGVEAAGISVSGSRQAQAGQGEQNHALNHRDAAGASKELPITGPMAGDCNPDPYQALRRALELVWETAPREERGRYFLQTAIDILYEGQRGSHDE